ncbi:MAG: hypothetical protein KDC09_07035 [Bacteroidales bacterium]|nr:hypothetical protein [Bacteroidales bacterium]
MDRKKKENYIVGHFSKKWKYYVIVLFIFIIYGNTTQNKYALDDHLVVINNPVILKGISGIPEIFKTRYSETEGNLSYGYRPIVKSSFAIEYSLWKFNPALSHLVNVLLYIFLCLLLYKVLQRILQNYHFSVPLIALLIFAAHPTHTEVVASLKNRDEILGLIGSIASLLFFFKYAESKKTLFFAMGIIAFIFSLLSKATAAPYVGIIPLFLYFFSKIKLKNIIFVFAGLALTFILLRYFQDLFLPDTYRPRMLYENPLRNESVIMKISTGFYILFFYLKKLIIPYPLLYYYGYNMIPTMSFANISVIVSVIFHLAIFIWALINIRKKSIYSFLILFYLGAIFLYSNMYKEVMGIVGERFLFSPSIPFAILLSLVIFSLSRVLSKNKLNPGKKPVYLISALIILPYSALTINRNFEWKDYFTLYSTDMAYLNNSVNANMLYAQKIKEKLDRNEFKNNEKQQYINLSIKHYKRVIEIFPKQHKAWNNLASMYFTYMKDSPKAILCFKKAIELKPSESEYTLNLANVYFGEKQFNTAISYFKKTNKLDSLNHDPFFMIARCYIELNKPDSAKIYNDKLLNLAPASDLPYINLGSLSFLQKDTLQAIMYLEKAALLNPANRKTNITLENYYRFRGDNIKANYYRNLGKVNNKK